MSLNSTKMSLNDTKCTLFFPGLLLGGSSCGYECRYLYQSSLDRLYIIESCSLQFATCTVLLHNLPAEDEDLDLLHRHSLLKCPGAVLVADNVLSTAAVGLLWRTGRGTCISCMKLFMDGLGEAHVQQSLESFKTSID